MARYFIQLAYKGTHYNGWQKQKNSLGIQELIEEKLSLLLSAKTEIVGAGRTDTGVHATEYFAHFDFNGNLDNNLLTYKMNCLLPNDIAIKRIVAVIDDAHARYTALSRTYLYHIHTLKSPFKQDISLYFPHKINIALMQEAANLLRTYHDFECFSKVDTDVNNFNCTIYEAIWTQPTEHEFIFKIKANRFLRNMVRAITGTLLDVGLEKKSIFDFKDIINSKDRQKAGKSVDAKGLFLANIEYPDEIFLNCQ